MARLHNLRLKIADVLQIGIESHAPRHYNAHGKHRGYQPDKPPNALKFETVEPLEQPKRARRFAVAFRVEELRQKNQAEQRSAHHSQRRKHSEIAQQRRLCEQQPHKRANGGDGAQQHGPRLFAQHTFGVANILIMSDYVQAVTQRHAQHNGADAECHKRHSALNQIDASQGEGHTVNDWRNEHWQRRFVAHTEQQHGADEQQRKAHCEQKVCLDLARVEHALNGCAVEQHVNARVRLLQSRNFGLNLVGKTGASFRVEGHKIRCQQGDGHGAVGRCQMALDERETARAAVAAFA